VRVLVDTNVILDVLTKREPFYIDSARVWSLAAEGVIQACVAAITVSNLYYIVNKLKDRGTAGALADRVLDDFDVTPLTADILRQSRTLPEKDLEDMIQYFSALHQGCEVLVTRNKRDFPAAGLKVLTPAEFLEAVAEFQ